MTHEEANEILDILNSELGNEFGIALRLIKEAINVQVPKVPDIYGDGYDDDGALIFDSWKCPNCEKSYELDYDKYDYCPCCGQAIDWSNWEE